MGKYHKTDRKNRKWSEAEDDLLRRLWSKGVLVKLMVGQFGTRKEPAIRSRIFKLKLTSRNYYPHSGRLWFLAPKYLTDAASKRATELGMSRSHYIQRLLRNDLGYN